MGIFIYSCVLFLVINLKYCSCQFFFSGTSSTLSPGITSNQCVCVTSGYCNRTSGTAIASTNDGSGVIDIRIINSGTGGTVTTLTTPASTGISTIINTQSFCQNGMDLCCLTYGYQCGVRFPPITGAPTASTGQAPYGSFPWFVLIFLQNSNTYVGSGVLIDHMHILTVAHKVTSYIATPSSLKIRVGDWDIGNGWEPVNPMEFNVIRIFIHSQFNSQSLANSVAILRVSPNVPLGLTPTIATACLSTNLITAGRCWVAGYAQNAFTSTTATTVLQQVDLPIVDQASCLSLLRTTRLGSGFVLDPLSFLCAGGQTGRDACTGDGGSGLMCFSNSQWYVVGLVAWGIGCGTSNVPGVYINVTNYLSWIQATTTQL